MPKFDVFAFFKRFPKLAFVILLGLSLYTGPKAWDEAQIEGLRPGLQTVAATVLTRYEQGLKRRACHVTAKAEGETIDTQIDCDDRETYEPGATIEVFQEGDRWSSLSIAKGHFYFDLV